MSERDELIECLRVCGACHGCGIGADGDTCTNCGDERQLNRLAASLLERDGAELERLRAEVERLTDERERGTAALRTAFGPELWQLGHPAYVVVHLREEIEKVTRLWKAATVERDALRASLASEKECQGAFVIRVLGQENYDNSPCQAHPLELVENEIERLHAEVAEYSRAMMQEEREKNAALAEVAQLTAERDGPRNRCPQCDQLRLELGEARHRLAALPADWRKDSSLETWFPITAMQMESLQAERDALLARVEAAERDAGRYRWLRNESLHRLIRGPICIDADTWGEPVMACGKHITLDGATLDAAIDAAMEGGK